MHLPPHGLLCTGSHWRANGEAFLTVTDASGQESEVPLDLGERLAWSTRGPRRCVGIRHARRTKRLMCPVGASIAETATSSQCASCSAADPSGAIARDATPEDPRPFRMYLAWFAPGVLKIGITAVARGRTRLLEQAAIGYTWLAEGALLATRRAEHHAIGVGLRDRIPNATKIAAWPEAAGAQPSGAELEAAHRTLMESPGWGEGLIRLTTEIHDLRPVYGLEQALPERLDVVTGLNGEVTVNAELLARGGHNAVLAPATGPGYLLDLRLLEGWILAPERSGPGRAPASRPMRPMNRGDAQTVEQPLF
jgi:hypothetical protein